MRKDNFEILKELLKNDRSFRKFDGNYRVDENILMQIIELTRYCSSARNLQPLKYYIIHDEEKCHEIYPLLKWAGYLDDWEGPEEGERPTAYLIQCLDTSITQNPLCDDGLQLQTITLGAVAKGLGCCIIKSFNITKLKEVLTLSVNLEPLYVIALGKSVEKVVIEDLNKDRDIKYYRTKNGIHHVPKRPLYDLIINKTDIDLPLIKP